MRRQATRRAMAMTDKRHLILASGSAARRALLNNAGLTFDVMPADIDEDAVKSAVLSADPHATPDDIAMRLASEKARAVSRQHPGILVIGADQLLVFGDMLYAKVGSLIEARAVLKKLRGRTHLLISAAALARDGEVIWQGSETARLTMREFSDAYLAQYLETAGASILACVGCYELEGKGIQLFEKIEGDYFTILGLPLLPLMAALRANGAVMA